jgi:hypothetical protein
MQFRRADLADLAYFLEVARHHSFRRAASIQNRAGGSPISIRVPYFSGACVENATGFLNTKVTAVVKTRVDELI